MRRLRSILLLPFLYLAVGCGAQPEPAPPLNESTQSAIEQEDAAVYEEESQQ